MRPPHFSLAQYIWLSPEERTRYLAEQRAWLHELRLVLEDRRQQYTSMREELRVQMALLQQQRTRLTRW